MFLAFSSKLQRGQNTTVEPTLLGAQVGADRSEGQSSTHSFATSRMEHSRNMGMPVEGKYRSSE